MTRWLMLKIIAPPEKAVAHVRAPIAQHGGSSVAESVFTPLSGNEPPVPSFPIEKQKKEPPLRSKPQTRL